MAVKTLMTDETGLLIAEAIREKAKLEDRVAELEKNKVDKSSIAQTPGTAEDKVMSQKATTEELEKKFDKSNVVQSTGDAEDKVMSQAAATAEFAKLSEENDEVKATLDNLIFKPVLNFTDCIMLDYHDGAEHKHTPAGAPYIDYWTTDYIDISDFVGKCLFVGTNVLPSDAGIVLFDENKTFIKGVRINETLDISTEIREFEINVPVNAKYIKFTCMGELLGDAYLVAYKKLVDLDEKFEKLNNATKAELNSKIDKNQSKSLNAYFNHISGNIVAVHSNKAKAIYPNIHIEAKQEEGTPSIQAPKNIVGTNTVDINHLGANLIPKPYFAGNFDLNGITFTANDDGSITLNGTATATTNYQFVLDYTLPKGKYTYKLFNGVANRVQLVFGGSSSMLDVYVSGIDGTFIMKDNGALGVCLLQVLQNATVNNLTVYPMLICGDDEITEYTPYVNKKYSVKLNETVYGGCVDFENRKIVETHRMVILTSPPEEVYEHNGLYTYIQTIGTQADLPIDIAYSATDGVLCNYFAQGYNDNNSTVGNKVMCFNSNGFVFVRFTTVKNQAELTELFAENPLQILLTLSETQEKELSANADMISYDDVNTFYTDGFNNITVSYNVELNHEMRKVASGEIKKSSENGYRKYTLPKLYLYGVPTGMNKDTEKEFSYVYGDRTGTLTCKWQGSSSLTFPKKNYTLKFDSKFEAVEGWGEQKKYCLKANWVDFSHLRNILGAKLWGQMVKSRSGSDTLTTTLKGLPNGGAIDGFPIMLFINDEYQGLYTWNIPKDAWMFGMNGDNTNEAIIVAEVGGTSATNFKAEAKCDGTDYEFEYSATEDDEVDTAAQNAKKLLNNLIAYCNGDTFDKAKFESMIDIQSAIDYYILAVCLTHVDGLSKNYILATYDGAKLFVTAYDMDATFGNAFDCTRFRNAVGEVTFGGYGTSHRLMNIIKTHYSAQLKDRYAYLRRNILSENNIMTTSLNFTGVIPANLFKREMEIWVDIPGTQTSNVWQIIENMRIRLPSIDKEIDGM